MGVAVVAMQVPTTIHRCHFLVMGTSVIYSRISVDEYDGAGVARRKADCRELVDREA